MKEDERLPKFQERLEKIGIFITIGINYPWVYLLSINGNRVEEKKDSEHGYTLGFMPIRKGGVFKFTDIGSLFKQIRKGMAKE